MTHVIFCSCIKKSIWARDQLLNTSSVTAHEVNPALSTSRAVHLEELLQDRWFHQRDSDICQRLPTKGGEVEAGDE